MLKSGLKRRSEGNMRVNEDKQMRCYVTCKCKRFKECKNVGRNPFATGRGSYKTKLLKSVIIF